MNRREFLRNSGGFAALSVSAHPASALLNEPSSASIALPPWQPGLLDIHHINTGRGNSTLVRMPDGTSLLIDAGASGTQGAAMNAARPDSSRRPGQWIARYIERQLKTSLRPNLDYALMTHLHGDHVGEVTPQSPPSARGEYKLTGISDVAEAIPIAKLIDRAYPNYSYPSPLTDPTSLNYIQFTKSAARRGTVVEGARPGSLNQITQLHSPAQQPVFDVRVLTCNGEVAASEGETSQPHFPPISTLSPAQFPSENSCSIALRLSYGKFSYFTGGDLNCDTNYGRDPWRDIESAAAHAAGPVSVSTCNHHGYFDSTGPEFVRTLRPKVWIVQSWHASHPAMSTLANLYSPILYPGPRDVFSLSLNPATALACARFSDLFKSSEGHVVVRVPSGGADFTIFVIEDADESNQIRATFGPYPT